MDDKPMILVVDDSEISRSTLTGYFQRLGCDVVCLESAEEAWKSLCAGEKVDAIILDWHLPLGMSGPALNRKIISDERFKGIPVIAFSSRWNGLANTPEARDWVASFMGDSGGRFRPGGSDPVAKFYGESDARHVPPELVVSLVERLEQVGRHLPQPLQEAALALKLQSQRI